MIWIQSILFWIWVDEEEEEVTPLLFQSVKDMICSWIFFWKKANFLDLLWTFENIRTRSWFSRDAFSCDSDRIIEEFKKRIR